MKAKLICAISKGRVELFETLEQSIPLSAFCGFIFGTFLDSYSGGSREFSNKERNLFARLVCSTFLTCWMFSFHFEIQFQKWYLGENILWNGQNVFSISISFRKCFSSISFFYEFLNLSKSKCDFPFRCTSMYSFALHYVSQFVRSCVLIFFSVIVMLSPPTIYFTPKIADVIRKA